MLAVMIQRLQLSQTLTEICVATTTNEADDPIVALATKLGVRAFRGSEHDVLARVVAAARTSHADVIVETTGDCPLIDSTILDGCVLTYFSEDCHYCSNALEPTFPKGLEVQVFSRSVLEEVDRSTTDPADREHVSLYIYEHPEQYRVRSMRAVGTLHKPGWRWTVDTQEDLDLVRSIVDQLGHTFSALHAVKFLEANRHLLEINQHVEQKPVR